MSTTGTTSTPSPEVLSLAEALGKTMAADVLSGVLSLIDPKADPIDTAAVLLAQNLKKFGDHSVTLTEHAKASMLSSLSELCSRKPTSASEKHGNSTRMMKGRPIRWWAELFADGVDTLNKSDSPLARPHWDQVHIIIRNVKADLMASHADEAEREEHIEEFLDWFHEALPEPPEDQRGLMAFVESIAALSLMEND